MEETSGAGGASAGGPREEDFMLAATLPALLDFSRSNDTLLDTWGSSSSESKPCLSDRRSSNFFIVDSRLWSDGPVALHGAEEEGEEGEGEGEV